MKTLLLMRHAKSSWKQEGQPDHDRPLNDRGKRDAPRMGRLLEEEGIRPDRILCSSAKRARKTAKAVAEALDSADAIEIRDELYGAGPSEYVALLQGLPGDINTAMIVAHDPTMSEFVSALSETSVEMPTAAIACFKLAIDVWADFGPAMGCERRGLWLPRELAE